MAPSKLIHDAVNNDTFLGHLILCHQCFVFLSWEDFGSAGCIGVTAVYLFKGIKQQAEWACCGTWYNNYNIIYIYISVVGDIRGLSISDGDSIHSQWSFIDKRWLWNHFVVHASLGRRRLAPSKRNKSLSRRICFTFKTLGKIESSTNLRNSLQSLSLSNIFDPHFTKLHGHKHSRQSNRKNPQRHFDWIKVVVHLVMRVCLVMRDVIWWYVMVFTYILWSSY